MPPFHKRGAAYRINPKPADPNSDYSKSLRADIQRKLEALTKPPQPVTTLADMSPEKQEEMKALYAGGPKRKA
jgi:hypothetical protein